MTRIIGIVGVLFFVTGCAPADDGKPVAEEVECRAGQFWNATLSSPGCQAHGKCGPGSGVVTAGTTTTDTTCEVCSAGVSRNNRDESTCACAPISICFAGNGVSVLPTTTPDTSYEACVLGTSFSNLGDANQACTGIDTCSSGYGVTTAATEASNRPRG
jgi:hypothetical protein